VKFTRVYRIHCRQNALGPNTFQDILTEVYYGAFCWSLICDVRASVECATVCHQQLADVTNGCPCSICNPQYRSVLVCLCIWAFLCPAFQTLSHLYPSLHPLRAMASLRLLIFITFSYIYYPTESGGFIEASVTWVIFSRFM
jgi:hypothetical protein